MLGATSIQVNTFPSGHAAEGLAGALLVTAAPPAIVLPMFAAALAVAAGAVLGRYHYLVDAIAGWIVASWCLWQSADECQLAQFNAATFHVQNYQREAARIANA